MKINEILSEQKTREQMSVMDLLSGQSGSHFNRTGDLFKNAFGEKLSKKELEYLKSDKDASLCYYKSGSTWTVMMQSKKKPADPPIAEKGQWVLFNDRELVWEPNKA